MEWALTAGTAGLYNSKTILQYFNRVSLTCVCFGPALHSVAMGLSSATEILRSADLGWWIQSVEAPDGIICRSGWIYLGHLGKESYGSWSSICLIKSLLRVCCLWDILSQKQPLLFPPDIVQTRFHEPAKLCSLSWDSYPIEPLSEHHHIHEGHEAIREHLEWAYKDGKGSMGEMCEVWLRSCGLFGSKKRRQTGGLMAVCSSFKDNHDRSEWTPGRMMKFQRRQAENKQLGRCPTGWHLLEFILMLS